MDIFPNKKIASGAIWSGIEKFGTQFLLLVFGILIARELDPNDYGLFGIASVLLGIALILSDGGLSTALVQKRDRIKEDFNSVFFFNIFVATVIYTLIFLFAPKIAIFFNDTSLTSVIRILGIAILITALSSIQIAIIQIELNFRLQFYASFISIIFSGVLGLVLAHSGFGVWALVVMHLVRSFLLTILLWICSSWKPDLRYDLDRFLSLFNFGYKILISGLMNSVQNGFTVSSIGKFFSVAEVGLYNRAEQLSRYFVNNMSSAIQRVTFPLLAEIQDMPDQLLYYHRKILKISLFFVIPVLSLLAILAEPLIIILLTSKWVGAAWIMQVLCIQFLFYPMNALNISLINAHGRSDIFLKIDVIKRCIMVVFLVLALPFGIKAVLWSQVIAAIICTFINCFAIKGLFKYKFEEQIKDIVPIYLTTAISSFITIVVNISTPSNLLNIVISALVMLTTFILLSTKLHKSEIVFIRKYIFNM